MRSIYELIWAEKPDHIINLSQQPSYNRTVTTLHLSPVGFKPRPKDDSELKKIITDILKGVRWLHGHGYVHRDIRWDNIIQESNGRSRLIDLEQAGKVGRPGFTLADWPSLDSRGRYRKKMDMQLIASLMRHYQNLLTGNHQAQEFVRNMEDGSLSAETSLEDSWLCS